MPTDHPGLVGDRSADAMHVAMPDTLFPQRFTPFEFYFLLEDRADYPSVFPVRLECRGAFDQGAFERAFQLAHARHPLLSARIECEGRQWPSWVAGEPAPIRWTDESDLLAAPCTPCDSTSGLKAIVSRAGDKTTMLFVFPHIAADGIGAFQFITDLMVAYAHGCSGNACPPPWRSLDHELLRDRDGHQLFGRRLKAIDLVRIAKVMLSLLVRRAAVVSDRGYQTSAQRSEFSVPEFLLHTLSVADTEKLTLIARKRSVRLNDLLVRDYFLMLADWNRNTTEARRPIRILVPTNLRRKQDYRMPAANVFSFAFLTRRGGDCRQREDLLRSVHAEMNLIKSQKRGLYYEAGMRLLCVWPALLRRSLQRKWPFATAIFTNLGAGFEHVPLPWREGRRTAGDLVLEAGYGAGPIRPDTRVSVAVHTYAGRMSIALRCDSQVFGFREQHAILQAYLDQLQITLDSES
jgi:hypothetical protein